MAENGDQISPPAPILNGSSGQLEVYTKGTKAWFMDEEEGWVVGSLTNKTIDDKKVVMTFFIDSRSKDVTYEQTIEKLEQTKYADLPPLKNPPILEGIDDLADLSYLHEPAVLHNVRLRYSQEQIYTYSGIVLIAMNPFKRMNIYSSEIMREYSGKRRGELEPHLFAVAEEAYRTMIREKQNQSIIVSGESGAGKTQSAKYIMRYFAIVDELNGSRYGSVTDVNANQANSSGKTTEIEQAVLSTNPIMEAFGNSKTTRNDNSSRFGKYIEIMFENKPDGPGVKITGAKIRTYLLERSRLVFQPHSERNYHIFYQLCAAAPAAERKELGLDTWDKFYYLNQGEVGVVNEMNDGEEFAITQKALSTIGISVSMQWDIFRICAALLHIGNIKITQSRDESQISDDDPALETACRLLEVDKATFKKWMIKKQIITRSEKIVTNLNLYQSTVARDSLAKFIYSMLFDWIVKIVNQNLAGQQLSPEGRFIGVLDIYGFEHFKKNSFEQFCINYANEKLQQEFNQHVFKLEQEEYVAEQISWSFIDFNDNQPCIDMIENKLGILDLLDEECRLPSGADDSLITKLYQRFGTPQHKFFEKPRFGQKAFTIKHYACDVTYDIDGFIEKNKDTVADEQLAMLNESSFAFLKEVVTIEEPVESKEPPAPGRKAGVTKKPTLGSIFKGSLVQLMETIRQTEVHYIRCIKPNQAKQAFEFEAPMVLSQLRACGVLETIRISCAGYPSRWTFQEFADRYYLLVKSKLWSKDPKELTMNVVKSTINTEDKYQVGLTKIFFRAGQLAYLEKLRSERLRACVVEIQKYMRRSLYQQRFRRMRRAAIKIQASVRGWQARMRYKELRETNAVIRIQKLARGWIARRSYQKKKTAALRIQSVYRGYVARKTMQGLRRKKAAIKIQKVFRGYRARNEYKKNRRLVIRIQSYIRRRRAIKEFKALKIEARSVGKLKETNYRLESKLVELSQSLNAKNKENAELLDKVTHLESSVSHWKERFTKLEHDTKSKASDNEAELSTLKKEISEISDSRDALSKEVDKTQALVRKRDDEISQLKDEIEKLKEERIELKEKIKNAPKAEPAHDEAVVAALKREVASLREQMSKVVAGKYKADRISEQHYRSSSNNNDNNIPPTSPRSSVTPLTQTATSAISSIPSFFESAAHVTAQMAESLVRASTLERLAPTTPSKVSPLKELTLDTQNKERPIRMLEAADLEDEILDSLVTNLRIPLPSTQSVATKKEIFFPAHLIGYLMQELIHHGMTGRMTELLSHVMKAIQNLTMKFEDDYVSAFWLSNAFELVSVVKATKDRLSRTTVVGEEVMDSLLNIWSSLDRLMLDIYHGWIKELKKRLSNMIVPAIIENQSLPGYVCKQSGGIWGKWAKTSTSAQFSIDQLLNFLAKLSKTMKCYYMEESMSRQILTELVRVIGASAFNHLLFRKNFCTWKRGVQIQYNVSRLEEWCTGHHIEEASLHLQQLIQAAKLLTLNKTSPQDIEMIFDVCFLLNASQIKKLLSLYYAADFDSPLSPELVKIVSARAAVSEKSETLLIDLESVPELNKPQPRAIKQIETFIPSWINLPHIQAVISSSMTPGSPTPTQ